MTRRRLIGGVVLAALLSVLVYAVLAALTDAQAVLRTIADFPPAGVRGDACTHARLLRAPRHALALLRARAWLRAHVAGYVLPALLGHDDDRHARQGGRGAQGLHRPRACRHAHDVWCDAAVRRTARRSDRRAGAVDRRTFPRRTWLAVVPRRPRARHRRDARPRLRAVPRPGAAHGEQATVDEASVMPQPRQSRRR